MGNQNHPKKGSQIKVEPITSIRAIRKIKVMLEKKPLEHCYYVLGLNTNLRASDLLQIRIDQVRDIKEMDEIEIKEKKTGKLRRVSLNKSCVEAIEKVLTWKKYRGKKFLFEGQRGRWTVPAVSQKVKKWCRDAGLKGNYASHSLRKSWGYWQHRKHQVRLPELMVCFNHSSQKQTLDYLCIQPQEIRDVYRNVIG